MTQSKKKGKLVCTTGEHYWMEQQLAKYRYNLQRSLFQAPALHAGIPVSKNKQESTQAYAIIIEFFQKAIDAFSIEPGTELTTPIRISNSFVADLKSLDKNNLINIDLVPKGKS